MQEQQISDREPTLGPQQHGQEQQEGHPCQQSAEGEQPQRCSPETAPDRQSQQTQQHRGPNPQHTQQHAAPSAANQRTHPKLQLASVRQQRYDLELAVLEASLRSPDPFCPRRFITSDATVSPVHKKHKALALDVSDKDTTAQEEQGLATPKGQHQASLQLAQVSSAGLAAGTMAAMLAAEAARSAALERYSSMSLLSPSGGFFAGPMRTPRFSAVLAADMEPQEPQSADTAAEAAAAAAGAGAAGVGGAKAAGVRSPGTALAGSKRKFNDQCTENCETAQAVAMSSPTQGGGPSLAALQQWQQTIEAAEQQWGSSHPAVGRAWLELARALQAADKDSDRAKHATKKAFDICQILLQQTGTESHAQDSFEYLLAKFNTKATAAKQAAAADSAREAAEATTSAAGAAAAAETCLLPLSAPMVAAMQLSAPMLMPFEVKQLPGSPAAAEQMPYMQSTYMQYPPSAHHMALQGLPSLPAIHLPLGGALSALPPASGSPAAQLLAADMQAAALMMSCGYPSSALLPHAALLHAAGTPTAADCLGLMPPSLLYGSPGSGRHLATAAGAPAARKAACSQPGKAPGPTGVDRAAAAKAHTDSKAAAACDRSVVSDDQGQSAQPQAKVVLNL